MAAKQVTARPTVAVELLSADDLLELEVASAKKVLASVRRAKARLAGYEAQVVDSIQVLSGRLKPQPPEPDLDTEPETSTDQGTDPDAETDGGDATDATDPSDQSDQSDPSGQSGGGTGAVTEPSAREKLEAERRSIRLRAFPKVGKALREGLINEEQADVLASSGLPAHRVDELLADAMLSKSADLTRQQVRNAIDEADRHSPAVRLLRQQQLRRLAHGVDQDGNFWFNLVVDPITGEAILDKFETAVRALWHNEDKQSSTRTGKRNNNRGPTRTSRQRRADAFAGLVLNSTAKGSQRAGQMPEVGAHLVIDVPNMLKLAIADPEAIAWTISGRQVPATEWQKLLDTRAEVFAWVLAADSNEVKLGRTSRHATEVQRYGLAIRDGTCTGEHCDRHPLACEAHHIEEWEQDLGPTDIALLALQCPPEHTDLHAAGERLAPGIEPGQWSRIQRHTGKTIKTWTNPPPPWRST